MKVCFVGIGSIGKRHIKNFSKVCCEENVELQVDVLRTTNNKLDDDIEKMITKSCMHIEELDEKYDAVFVTNPTYKHYDTIKIFLNKTDAFFVEKPVFDTLDNDLESLIKKGKKYYVACPLRYTNVLIKAKEIIDNEKVISARAISSSYLPTWRKGIDYRNTYSAHKEQGGGVRIDLIHEWDYLNSLFGVPEKVHSMSGKYSDLEINSEDLAIYIAEYSDKLVELHLDYFGRKTRRSLELRTLEHEYICDIAESKIIRDGIAIEEFVEDANDKYIKEMQFFLKILFGRVDSTNTLIDAINTMKIAY